MTNDQFQTIRRDLLEMILFILENEEKEKAIELIESLLKKKS